MTDKKKLLSSKKFRYGTSAIVFTVVFVAFVILLNVMVSIIDARTGGLYFDLTTEKLYGISEATVKALSDTDAAVEIIFCQARDKIAEDDLLNPVKMLAESYENKFDNIDIVYKDRISNPKYFNELSKKAVGTSVNIDNESIVVNCRSTGICKVFRLTDMYKLTYTNEGYLIPFAFNGENKITSAILSVARNEEDAPKAGLVTGHGENVGHDIHHYLEDYGYETSTVDLKSITKQELSEYDLIIVNNPISDFIGMGDASSNDTLMGLQGPVAQEDGVQMPVSNQSSSVNEIAKLRDYVTEDFGNVMFFFDPFTTSNLSEIQALVNDSFGVSVNNISYVYDDKNMIVASGYPEEWRYFGSYSKDSESAGYALHKSVSSAGTGLLPAFGISCKMDIPKKIVGNFEVSSVVETSYGEPLITLSKYARLVGDIEKSANVIVCGSSGFINELDSTSLANGDLFRQMLVSMGNETIVEGIEFKVLDETTINVSKEMTEDMNDKLVIIIPVIIAIIGVLVYIKRKYL